MDLSQGGGFFVMDSNHSNFYRSKGYEFVNVLGHGGLSIRVILARRIADNQQVAIKEIDLVRLMMMDKKLYALILEEANILKRLEHENIVQFYGSLVEEDNMFCMVMEYCESGDLQQEIERMLNGTSQRGSAGHVHHQANNTLARHFTELEIKAWLVPLVAVIQWLHDRDIFHRDITAKNVFLRNNGQTIKLGDFGLSKKIEEENRASFHALTTCVHTPAYMSPEYCRGDGYTKRSEAWSIGILTYQLAMLTFPFKFKRNGNLMTLAVDIVNSPHAPIASQYYSGVMSHFVDRLLVKDQKERMTVSEALQHKFITADLGDAGNEADSQQKAMQPNDESAVIPLITSNTDRRRHPLAIIRSLFLGNPCVRRNGNNKIKLYSKWRVATNRFKFPVQTADERIVGIIDLNAIFSAPSRFFVISLKGRIYILSEDLVPICSSDLDNKSDVRHVAFHRQLATFYITFYYFPGIYVARLRKEQVKSSRLDEITKTERLIDLKGWSFCGLHITDDFLFCCDREGGRIGVWNVRNVTPTYQNPLVIYQKPLEFDAFNPTCSSLFLPQSATFADYQQFLLAVTDYRNDAVYLFSIEKRHFDNVELSILGAPSVPLVLVKTLAGKGIRLGQVFAPCEVRFDEALDGDFIVSDWKNNRAQIYSATSKTASTRKKYEAVWSSPQFNHGCFIAAVFDSNNDNKNKTKLCLAGLTSGEVVLLK